MGYLAYIIPVDQGARPDQSLPGNQPYPGQGLPGFQPYPDQGLPGNQPYPDQGLPVQLPRPDQSLPGNQPYPDQGLPRPQLRPTHPIYVPIAPPPGSGSPEHPIYIPIYPAHPIVIPPNTPPDQIYEQIKEKLGFIFGNMPTDPNEKPQPVKK